MVVLRQDGGGWQCFGATVLNFGSGLVLPGRQDHPPLQSLIVDSLDDPRTSGAFGRIVDSALSVDVKENVLHKVLRLDFIAENSPAYSANDSEVAAKQAKFVPRPVPAQFDTA
jgi:hypothetical protein